MGMDDQFDILFSYHFDTLEHLLELAAEVDQAAYFAESGYGRGSLHDLLFHVLIADHIWRGGLESGSRPPGLDSERYPDLESLIELLEEERNAWKSYLEDQPEEDVSSVVHLRSGVAGELALPRWHYQQHVILHGMQHFAEIAQRLTDLGHSPGNIDFIYYSAGR